MALNFPDTPLVNDEFTAGGRTWKYNGTRWLALTNQSVARISDTAPIGPNDGDIWYRSDVGSTFMWYQDGTSSQWVEIIGETGPAGAGTAPDIRALGFFDLSNDGAGSGLDADLLDGLQATAFATAAQGATADSALQPADIGVTVQAYSVGFSNISAFGETLIDDVSASVARATLGLGGLATASSVDGTVWSGTDLAVADGGTGASDAATARTNLGVGIGVNVQAYDADLTTIAAANNGAVLAATTASFLIADETKLDGIEAGADVTDTANVTAAGALMDSELTSLSGVKSLTVPDSTTISAFGKTLVDDTSAAAAIATLGLNANLASFVLPASTTISAFGRTLVDDTSAAAVIATLGLNANLASFVLPASTTISAYGASLVDDADAITARATLGLTIGTNVQAYDAELAALAGLTSAADKLPYFTGSGTAATTDFTAAARSELASMGTPQTIAGTTDTLAAGDRRRLTQYSDAAQVNVTVPAGTFVAGDWFMLQSTGAGGLTLTTTGLTVNANKKTVIQYEGLFVVFTASNTISVFGGTSA